MSVTLKQRRAFEQNYERSKGLAYRLAGAFPLYQRDDAVSAAMVRLWSATGRYNPKSAWTTFAFPHIKGGIIDFLRKDQGACGWNRKQKRYTCAVTPISEEHEHGREDNALLGIEHADLVEKVFKAAKENERYILLAYLKAGSQRGAAELCGVAQSWVSQVFINIRKRLAA
jgi:RNA polymerase sigma factor (sigma-70 family)